MNTSFSPLKPKGNADLIADDISSNCINFAMNEIVENLPDESPKKEVIYPARVKITRRKERLPKSMTFGSENNHSFDDPAFKLLLLRLSSQGQFVENMQRELLRKQRFKSILEKNLEKEKRKIANNFEINYKHGGEKDFIRKIFKSK